MIGGIVEDLVKKVLENNIPDLECYGKDIRLFEIAYSDLELYLMNKWNMDTQSNLEFRTKFLDCITEEGEDILPLLELWAKNWYMKWKQRVKVVFNSEKWNRNYKQVTRLMNKGGSKLSASELREFTYPIATTLLEHGELACLRIMSENFIKLHMVNIQESPTTVQEKLNMINSIIRDAVSKIAFKGPIIFIKVGNLYFRNL